MVKLKNILFRFIFLTFILFLGDRSFSQENIANTANANIEIIYSDSYLQDNNELIIGLKFKLTPGWHIYWKNPGDSGLPVQIEWDLPEGIEFEEILWPAPQIAPLDPLTSYGYYDEVILPIRFSIDSNFSLESRFSALLSFLICEEICVPEDTNILIDFSRFSQAQLDDASSVLKYWMDKLPIEANFIIQTFQSDNTFKILWESNYALDSAYFYPEQNGLINYSSEQILNESSDGYFLTIDRPDQFREEINFVSGVLELNDNEKKEFFQIGSNIKNVSFIEVNKSQGLSFFLAIFLAFVGGIILNAMPCVFPVIALKVMSLINESGKNNSWKHGLIFTIGIEISMVILLVATLMLKNLGQFVGWGWQLQSSLMSSLLALLFFVLGMILLSRLEIGNFFTRLGNLNSNKTGYTNSFLLGFLTVIVATPCTGPYMGAAIGWGIAQPALVSTSIFLSLGFGIAFPTLILSILPKGIRLLPKPGNWMGALSRLMAVPMFLTAMWLTWVVFRQVGYEGLFILLLSIFSIIIAFIALNFSSNFIKKTSVVFSSVSILILIFFLPAENNNPKTLIEIGEEWSTERVSQLRFEKRNILLNFTADWCLTCKVNERLVLNSKEFISLVETGKIAYLVADWTKYDPEITAELEKYKRAGVPLYLYWSEGSDEVKILPAVLTKSILYGNLKL